MCFNNIVVSADLKLKIGLAYFSLQEGEVSLWHTGHFNELVNRLTELFKIFENLVAWQVACTACVCLPSSIDRSNHGYRKKDFSLPVKKNCLLD